MTVINVFGCASGSICRTSDGAFRFGDSASGAEIDNVADIPDQPKYVKDAVAAWLKKKSAVKATNGEAK